MKIRKELLEQEKISYAMEHIELPEGGVDCSEGCNPYGFPPERAEALKQFDPARLGPYPHSDVLYDAIRDFWKEQIDVEHHNVLLTDGSISALYIINNIFDTHNSVVLGISPQFTDYYMHAEMIGIDYAPYQLKPQYNYKFDASEFMSTSRTLSRTRPGLSSPTTSSTSTTLTTRPASASTSKTSRG